MLASIAEKLQLIKTEYNIHVLQYEQLHWAIVLLPEVGGVLQGYAFQIVEKHDGDGTGKWSIDTGEVNLSKTDSLGGVTIGHIKKSDIPVLKTVRVKPIVAFYRI